jgi:hypothetical protein
MMSFKELSGFELLERIELRGEDAHSWVAIVADSALAPDAVEEFATEIQAQSDENTNVRVVPIEGLLLNDIRDKVQSPSNDAVILLGFEGRSKEFWASLDVNRSALERPGALFLWLSRSALSDLCRHAPNIRSYIGPSIFAFTGTKGALTVDARERRLKELAEKFHMSNSEIIRRAEEKKIEPEPEFVEWLLLLRRSDLV